MKQFFTVSFVVFFFFVYSSDLFAQCNTAPCPFPIPSVNAQDACVLDSPSALDCYFGATTTDPPVSFPPSWCSAIHNNHWFAFTADAASATFDISVYGCAQGNGLQAAVLSTTDCIDFQFVSPCLGNIPTGTSATLVASPLNPGEVYYLCIDGSSGAVCDYSINGSDPTVSGSTTGLCFPGPAVGTYNADAPSNWTVNPPGAGIITPNANGTQVTVEWLVPGPVQICAQNANCPNAPVDCLDVTIGEDTETIEEVILCQNKTVTCAGKTISTPGQHLVTLPSYLNCDSVIRCVVTLVPTVYTNQTVYMCPGGSVDCAGETFELPGTFDVKFEAWQGCDSIVKCKVNQVPIYSSPWLPVTMCGPAEYTICNTTFNASGLVSETCTGWRGCDSIINVNLAILEPLAKIAPPKTIDCDSNKVITLDGSISSQNMAIGGLTTYKWTGPGIVGSNTSSTIQVNQPGQYCLVLTHSRAGIFCYDTTCVNVNAISAVPQLPQISGNGIPCGDSTVIYSATSVGNPPPTSFVWTTPGNQPFSSVNFSSIQITWDTVLNGQICVTAKNSCGTSQPACLPVSVQAPLIQPQMAGPLAICANSAAQQFTINVEQANTTYTWTAPAGATITGTGDSVMINFQNAVSGQVCVKAQNACGALPPVCQNIQVNPVPSASLGPDMAICAGESINLAFTLNGNGPFDVVYSNGSQNFTLNNISNGHVVPLTPNQSTTYSLVSFNDNSLPACTSPVNDQALVTVHPNISTTQTVKICEGETFFVGGALQSASGVYTDSLNTFHGCDSVVVSTLIVNQIDTTVVNTTTCDPNGGGTTVVTLNQFNGCDSVVISTITVLPTDTTKLFDNNCDPANAGVFVSQLTNQYGCDSTVILTVTYALSDTTYLSDVTCDPTAAGVFTQNLVTSDGCDSLLITTVNLLQKDTTLLSALDCNPNNVGTFVQDLSNQFGCDSTVITTVGFFHLDTIPLAATSCDPAAVGVFYQTLVTAAGCDSVLATTVSLLPSSTTNLSGKDCNPNNVGVFTTLLTNYLGCDSTVITTVSFDPIPQTNLTASTCDPAAAGIFTQTLLTAAGCDSTIVTDVKLLPSNTTNLFDTDCNPNNVGVFTKVLPNQYGCDSTVITTVTFSPNDTTLLSATTCKPAEAGVFTQKLITPAGCDSIVITTVNLLPSNQTAVQSSTCDPALAGVFVFNLFNKFGCDSIVTQTVALLPKDTTVLNFTTCDPSQVGTVPLKLVNQWGCDSLVLRVTSLLGPNSCGVNASLAGSTISCGNNAGTLTLTATVGEAPFNFTVKQGSATVQTGTFNALGTPQSIGGLPGGNYTVVVSSANGYSATAQATIVQLVPPSLNTSVASNFSGFSVSCSGASDGSAKAVPAGGAAPYTYLWSNGATGATANNLSAGSYTVLVTDLNGCTVSGAVNLEEPAPLSLSLQVANLDCFGKDDGVITVNALGGTPPYTYSLNDIKLQEFNTFQNLSAGVYTLTVFDANDCDETSATELKAPDPLVVELGDDRTIALGEELLLSAQTNYHVDSIYSVKWTPVLDSCQNCLEQLIKPLKSTLYSIIVEGNNGCKDEDKVRILVDRRRHVFVPNIINPDGDGQNTGLVIYAKTGTVTMIKNLQIYDRWGDAVYSLTNFQPNDESKAWDGKFRAKPLPPGVYVWYAEIEFIDGETELFKGDVTIMR